MQYLWNEISSWWKHWQKKSWSNINCNKRSDWFCCQRQILSYEKNRYREDNYMHWAQSNNDLIGNLQHNHLRNKEQYFKQHIWGKNQNRCCVFWRRGSHISKVKEGWKLAININVRICGKSHIEFHILLSIKWFTVFTRSK